MFRVQLSAKWLRNTLLAANDNDNNNNNSCTKMNVCHWISALAGYLEPQGSPTAGTCLLILYSCHWLVTSTWGAPKQPGIRLTAGRLFPRPPCAQFTSFTRAPVAICEDLKEKGGFSLEGSSILHGTFGGLSERRELRRGISFCVCSTQKRHNSALLSQTHTNTCCCCDWSWIGTNWFVHMLARHSGGQHVLSTQTCFHGTMAVSR